MGRICVCDKGRGCEECPIFKFHVENQQILTKTENNNNKYLSNKQVKSKTVTGAFREQMMKVTIAFLTKPSRTI